MSRFAVTMHGFEWGPIEVTRIMEIDGRVCVEVKTTAGKSVTIYSSAAGRSLRVFDGNRHELLRGEGR